MFLRIDRDDGTDLERLASIMTDMVEAGRGWINLMPDAVERHELGATRSVPGMIFGRVSGRGAPIPKITWTAPQRRRRRTEPAHLGIEHPAGPKARDQLADAGHPIPAHWPVLQDHTLRGLVVVPTVEAVGRSPIDQDSPEPAALPDHVVTIVWAIDAATILAGGELGAVWQAQAFDAP
jgi:hypothetical protein